MRELYRVLEVEPSADFASIRESYRRLLKRYHPDSGGTRADAAKLDAIIYAFRRLKAVHPEARQTALRRQSGTGRGRGSRAGAHGRTSTRASAAARTRTSARAGMDGAAEERRPLDVFSLGRMLTTGTSASARTFAARSLGNLGKRSAYTFLRRGLKDQEEQVVISCVRAIGRLRIAQSAGDLSAVFNAGSDEVRRAIMETVGEIDRLQLFRNLVLAGLEDSDASVRQRALKLFIKLER